MRRGREEDEALELFAALLRQSASRAVERVRQRRARILPIDALVLRYAMHFLDAKLFPVASYMAQAQAVVSEAIERVACSEHFEYVPLTALVESLVAENTADVMQRTVVSIEEFVDARDALGRWIEENCYDYENERENEEQRDAVLWRSAAVWRSAQFWVFVQEYIDALSLGSARVHAYALRPRYEKELMDVLNAAARAGRKSEGEKKRKGEGEKKRKGGGGGGEQNSKSGWASQAANAEKDGNKMEEEKEDKEDQGEEEEREERQEEEEREEEAASGALSALLADLAALAHCTAAAGVRAPFFEMAHARLNVIAACDRLAQFGARARVPPPPLTPQLTALQAQRDAISGEKAKKSRSDAQSREDIGVPLDFVPSEAYMQSVLEKQNDTLGEDEELFRDEIVDYYKTHPPRDTQKQEKQQSRQRVREKREEAQMALVKPHRFCKVKTGYTWTQYNRTHYDTRTNPPPRSVMWYEFTLFYPALMNTKRDMSRIYHIEDTPRGPNDNYCILVFSVGPPYADVAYQIVRKQWDPRPGGVRASFDATGTYRLFFRFTNSNYRR